MKKHAILVVLLSTMCFSNAQSFEKNFKADICESFQEEFSKVRNSKLAFNNSFKKELPKYASIIDGAIQEDDVNKKFVKGQEARNELKLKFQVDLVYDCDFYYRAKLEERKKVMAKGVIGVSMADLPRLDEQVAMYPISMNYASRGATHLFLGNLKDAELDLRESINTESKKNRFSKISKQTALLALVLEEQGRIEEAKELYSQIYAETEDLDAAVFRALADKNSGGAKKSFLTNKNSTTNSRREATNSRSTKRESKKEEVKNTTDLKKLFKLEDKKKNN